MSPPPPERQAAGYEPLIGRSKWFRHGVRAAYFCPSCDTWIPRRAMSSREAVCPGCGCTLVREQPGQPWGAVARDS